MPEDPKLTAYLASARSGQNAARTPQAVQAMKTRHEGCKAQYEEVAEKLRAAVVAGDANAVKQHEGLLRENWNLRKHLVGELRAAGQAISDAAVE